MTLRKFRSSLYYYGDGRAVNITHNDNGQITMELGGLDHCDRIPESHEAAKLAEDMYSFCTNFAEIERRLKECGVLMHERISMAPPAAENATIINLDEFEQVSHYSPETFHVEISDSIGKVEEMHAE